MLQMLMWQQQQQELKTETYLSINSKLHGQQARFCTTIKNKLSIALINIMIMITAATISIGADACSH